MANQRLRLDPESVEKVATRVVEILERRGLRQREMVGAAELARRLGVDRSWVYSRAIELGAVKLGNGPKARLRFDPEIAKQALRKLGEAPAADPPARSGERADRPRRADKPGRREPDFPLLPFRDEDEPSPGA